MPAAKDAVLEFLEERKKLSALNRQVDAQKKRKREAQQKLLRVLEEEELDSVKAAGQLASQYDIHFAVIQDKDAFREWAEQEDEVYFEAEPRIREDELNREVRRRLEDKEPLPPGVGFYTDHRISLQKAK